MKTIKILKSFNTTHYGFLEADKEYPVPDHFASYAVDGMRGAAVIVKKGKGKEKKSN